MTDDVYCDTVVSFTTGKLAIDFEMEDMTEADLERFRKAGIMEKVYLCIKSISKRVEL